MRGADRQAAAPERPLPLLLEVAGVVVLLVVSVAAAVVSVLLTPFRVGATLVPVAVVLAVGLNVVLPRLAFAMTGSRSVAALPVLTFFVAGFATSVSPGGDVLLAGGSDAQTLISYATLLGGVIAGAVSAVRAH